MHEETLYIIPASGIFFPEVIPCFSSWQYNYYFAKVKILTFN